MEIQEYRNIYQNEDTHVYYHQIHQLILDLIKCYISHPANLKILDAGCGTGLLGVKLKKYGEVVGIDISSQAIKFAKKRGLNVKKASIMKIPYPDNNFDVVTSVDVLYHKWVSDDVGALSEIQRVLKPGGLLIMRLPAYEWLRRHHDKVVYTKHRYVKRELKKILSMAGYSILKITYIQPLFLPVSIFTVIIERLFNNKITSDIRRVPKVVNTILNQIARLEMKTVKYCDYPFGIGLLSVAQKPM